MNSQLFIPDKIKVGFQKRDDCYTKQLGYIVYYDQKGVLRKETSWNSWRDHKLSPVDCDNVPHSGFVLNKDVKRTAEWFGSGRNMIRVWDSRGFEFEITTGNLLFVLMTTDCSKRGLVGEFVYAWWGTELILLPVGCEEYQNCVKYTGLQSCKIGAKDMVAGCFYETKKQEQLYYLGKLPWFNVKYGSTESRSNKKEYIFLNSKNELEPVKLDKLAKKITAAPDSNLGASMDIYSKSIHSAIVGASLKKVKIDWSVPEHCYYGYSRVYWVKDGDTFKKYKISDARRYGEPEKPDSEKQYYLSYLAAYSFEGGVLKKKEEPKRPYYYAHDNKDPLYNREQLESMELGELILALENSSKHKVDKIFYYI